MSLSLGHPSGPEEESVRQGRAVRFGLTAFSGFFAILFLMTNVFAQSFAPDMFGGLRWRMVGPFRGGRAEAAAGIPGDPNTYYFGSAAGGVWKSTNAGTSWTPIFDREPVASIGAIAIAPGNPNLIYVGTGEKCLRNDISFGDGVYKSTDAGQTWTNVGLKDSQHIANILIDPRNTNVIYVAAEGHASGPNEMRGVYKSTDGGSSWNKILYVDTKTGAADLIFDPNNPDTLYAAMYEQRRDAYTMVSGGPGSGLYKTTDGGANWKKIEGHGLPGGILGRIGVAVAGSNSNRVYAIVEAKENALYRSNDAGQSWEMLNNDPAWVRPWYQNHVFVDPKDPDSVYLLYLNVFRSTDGGAHFTSLGVPHSDDHDLWIDPTNPKRMIEADDGGATITTDGGITWTAENNQPTAQFYHASTDSEVNYRIYGSQQDSGSVSVMSRTDGGTIGEADWHPVGGGESGYIWPDPRDSQIVYAGDHNGHFTRWDGHTGQSQNIAPFFGARAWPAATLKHRFQWTSPMQLSPHDPNVLYLGAECVFKTTNGGMSWTQISPDLTRNDKSKQQSTPEPLTPDNSSAEYYDTVFAIAESPVQKNLIWVGTDDGIVQLTRDGGKIWNKVTPKDLPEWSRVNIIEPSRWAAGTAYMAADLHFSDNFTPMIFKTTDFGATWTKITNGIAANDYVHSIHEDTLRKGMLYAGTEFGIRVSFDDGANWQSLRLNLPPVPVYDTAIHGDDLIAATHGRAFWVLDNISALRQLKSETRAAAVLYTPAVATRKSGGGGFGGGGGRGRATAANPPAGAVIDYYLASAPSAPISLQIADARGQIVFRETSGEARAEGGGRGRGGRGGGGAGGNGLTAHAGLNRFVWNFRGEGSPLVPGFVVSEIRTEGPAVPPGTYQVKLSAGGQELTAPLVVALDRRSKATQADLDRQYEWGIKIRDRVTEIQNTVMAISEARASLENKKKANPNSAAAIDAMEKELVSIEGELIQLKSVNREAGLVYPIMLDAQYAELQGVIEGADSAPPAQVIEMFNEYEKRYEPLKARWQAAQTKLGQLGE